MTIKVDFVENEALFKVDFVENEALFSVTFGEVYAVSQSDSETYILVTPDGQEIPAVMVEELTVFDATANDIRKGKVAATDKGVITGTKVIPSYYTYTGWRAVSNKSAFILPNANYDYTKLQAIVCPFNISEKNSVSAEKVTINDVVYDVLSTNPISNVTKDHNNARIDFGIVNNSGKPYLIRYFMYKEIY